MKQRYWKVYEVEPPDYREYVGLFQASSAKKAVAECRAYHDRQFIRRALRKKLEAVETADERLYPHALNAE